MQPVTHQQLEDYCLAKPGATKSFPFGEGTAVFKVMGKMFALIGGDWDPPAINLKCDPDWSIILRQQYTAVAPGYHMSKKHWNTVTPDEQLPADEFWELVDHSYRLVAKGLKKADREKLARLADHLERNPPDM